MEDLIGTDAPLVDRTHKTFVDYIERTRAFYLASGFNNPYEWAHFRDVPFARLRKPLAESRAGIVTSAAPFQPDKGDQGPHAKYNNAAKFREVYVMPVEPVPDLRISHIGYDRHNTVPEDLNAYFPLAQLQHAAATGRVGEVSPRFYGVPTMRSQRATITRDAPRSWPNARQLALTLRSCRRFDRSVTRP